MALSCSTPNPSVLGEGKVGSRRSQEGKVWPGQDSTAKGSVVGPVAPSPAGPGRLSQEAPAAGPGRPPMWGTGAQAAEPQPVALLLLTRGGQSPLALGHLAGPCPPQVLQTPEPALSH